MHRCLAPRVPTAPKAAATHLSSVAAYKPPANSLRQPSAHNARPLAVQGGILWRRRRQQGAQAAAASRAPSAAGSARARPARKGGRQPPGLDALQPTNPQQQQPRRQQQQQERRPPPSQPPPPQQQQPPRRPPSPATLPELLEAAHQRYIEVQSRTSEGCSAPPAAAVAALLAVAKGLRLVQEPPEVARGHPEVQQWGAAALGALERGELAPPDTAAALWALAVLGWEVGAAALDATEQSLAASTLPWGGSVAVPVPTLAASIPESGTAAAAEGTAGAAGTGAAVASSAAPGAAAAGTARVAAPQSAAAGAGAAGTAAAVGAGAAAAAAPPAAEAGAGAAAAAGEEARARLSWALQRLGRPQAAAAVHAALPWQLLPGALPGATLEALLAEVALQRDVIRLADGREVEESRQTAWQSDAGHAFCYSGKRMVGGALSPQVAAIRDRLQQLVGVRYDSVLVNYYPDGKSGMRYHSDPLEEEGVRVWEDDTTVLSLGATREFVFRNALAHGANCEVPPQRPAKQQQPVQQQQQQQPPVQQQQQQQPPLQQQQQPRNRQPPPPPTVHWAYLVESGDAVRMFGDCQARFQHSIKVEREASHATPRMSLVFKLRLAGPLS